MKLIFSIEYRTRWGERLVLGIGSRRIAMRYAQEGIWSAEIPDYDPEAPAEYGYQVEVEGRVTRSEWRPHVLRLPADFAVDTLRIRDRWLEMPADAPLWSAAFTQGILARGPQAAARETVTAGGIRLRVSMPSVARDEVLALSGSGRELGDWQRIVPLDDDAFPEWTLPLSGTERFEYKFLIADRRTLAPIRWEEGPNRVWDDLPAADELLVDASAVPRFPARPWRSAGTAIPLFSLRTEEDFGVGEFYDLRLLIDWAAATGQRVIQLLPINDTSMTGTWEDSYPYNANSTFALHPQFIRLTAAGVEESDEYRRLREELNALPEVDYERVNRTKLQLLREAFARHGDSTASSTGYREFVDENRHWLRPYAAYCCLRDEHGTADFAQWGEHARYDEKRIEEYLHTHSEEAAFHCFVQYHLHRQLSEMTAYARSRGVVLKGDLPIGISRTSADAWQRPELFHMDAQAGAPPDAFSASGQNWGFPTYDWERMARDGYAWWRARLGKMADYFDAYRIDHILGFFRIWEIPTHAIHGLLGCFNPALPYAAEELREAGFDTTAGRYTKPEATAEVLDRLFGDLADEVAAECIEEGRVKAEYATQRRVAERFPGNDPRESRMREGLLTLLDDVLFNGDPRRKGFYHPRIGARTTFAYRMLDPARQQAFDRLHEDFFYRRHDRFWQESALRKLPAVIAATGMLACGEDLGMIPSSVPETMRMLQILSLEIQRMSKTLGETFADPARYPYHSVCTTSTHDMNPLRAWWEEDRALTERFYREVLGGRGEAPATCEPAICRRIVEMHLQSPSMLAILPLQDLLAMDGGLRAEDPHRERINIPAFPRFHWRYRLHLTLEQLLRAESFNEALRAMIAASGRR